MLVARLGERLELLGGEVDAITPGEMFALVERFVAVGRGAVIANHNSHSLYLARRDPRLRSFFAAANVIQADSRPMIAWGALLGLPLSRRHRSTYLDWRDEFWALADRRRWRVFYLGGAPGVAALACARLAQRWTHVTLGQHHGYFAADAGSQDNDRVLAAIAAFAPHILFVGMGMPRQEHWIEAHRPALGAAVVFSVGAAFDYEAGAQRAPPRWSGALGVEWLFRLIADPARLHRRYLIEPWSLAPAAMADVRARLGGRRRAWLRALTWSPASGAPPRPLRLAANENTILRSTKAASPIGAEEAAL